MYIRKYFVILITLAIVVVHAQYEMYFIANSNSADATAFNNSHKIAAEQPPSGTINVVYQSSDSICFVFTFDGGQSWSTPQVIYPGKYPAIDVSPQGFRYLAWQTLDTIHNTYEVYYDCIDDWSPPMNISQSTGHSILPDLVVDSNEVVHIVWAEDVGGYNQIYHRVVFQGILGDTVRLSDFGSNEAAYTHPSISIFQPNNRVYAIWECYDSLCYSPYQIHLRYKETDTWSQTTSWAHYLPMRHPSFDYAHTWDTLSFCYEDSTSGNMEPTFYGGNGGGYATPGYSTYPVVSTVYTTWSYLFWQEDSAGFIDILYDLYYEMSGWTQGSLRDYFGIQEPTRFPSASDAYLIWTQGDNPPYSVYFADFGYPIGIEETSQASRMNLSARPNPFSQMTDIRYEITDKDLRTQGEGYELAIYDSSGRLVKNLRPLSVNANQVSVEWCGDDNTGNELPAGIYFVTTKDLKENNPLKLVKLN
jgi:hypothetical protein